MKRRSTAVGKTTRDYVAEISAVAFQSGETWTNAQIGLDVLRAQVDELWDAVKSNELENARRVAVQVGAMAVRFLRESEQWERITEYH